MDSGYYAATAGLIARTQALDTIANNLANASTTGFRASHNVFRSMLANADGAKLSVVNQDANDYGVLGGAELDTTQGALIETGNDLDLAMEGPGYFEVQTSSGTAYTRGGSFRVSTAGQLVTAAGDPVVGDNGPISIVGQPVSISDDGTITINGAIAGHLKQVEFPSGTQIESAGKGYFVAPAGASVPATQSSVRQGKLESSNVNPLNNVIELISAQREFETMRRALTMFSSEMDKTAVTELPHVG
jgi:flagellar basal-body rod protein FlgF/flagellar basal-body rod protein FlgG